MKKKPTGYWTYERCKEEALKYKYRYEFDKNNCTAYRTALRNKWLDLFDHMERIGNKVKRLLYVYEFSDNHCYIGLTGNKNRRHLDHFKDKDSSVNKHYIKTGLEPKLYIKTEYLPVVDAVLLEEKFLNEYKENNWIILNQVKTGGIGGNDIKWNKETCKDASLKCKNARQFGKKYSGAYKVAAKYNWLDEFFPKTSKKGYWNDKDLCREEAKKYKNRIEFCYGSWAAYNYSSKNNWLYEFFPIRYRSKNKSLT